MSLRRHVTAWVFIALAAACFDPLYEDDAPLTATWRVCCQAGAIDTCLCEDAATCARPVYACAAGRCSESITCTSGSAGGGAGTGGGSSAGGGSGLQDAGAVSGGGAGGGGGASGGGGGASGGGTGGASGGGGGASGGGTGGGSTGAGTRYEFCCLNGTIQSCTCPASGCSGATFTACASGRCVATGECR
jgi:hypothetical protein